MATSYVTLGFMTFDKTIRIADCLTILSIIGSAIWVAITLVDSNNIKQASNKIKRAEFINGIVEKFLSDEKLSKAMYIVEYGDDTWYNKQFHGSELEPLIDRLLSYLSYICYLNKTHIICKEEFRVLHYEVARICRSEDTRAYLWNLYHCTKQEKRECAFEYLIEFGLENKLLGKDFIENSEDLYVKILPNNEHSHSPKYSASDNSTDII
jgi:hypothetical protein